jgi:succinyl-CoA synthetase beta subunit
MRDRSIRLAPVTVEVAKAMINEVKMLKIITGFRGKAKGDLHALAQTLSNLSQLALHPELYVLDAEVNPMMVMPEGYGVMAVDALIIKGVPF